MEDDALVRLLQEVLSRLDVEVRREAMPDEAMIRGGLCRVGGRQEVIVSPRASTTEQLDILLTALGSLDTDGVWLPPVVRDRLDSRQ